MMTRKLYYEDLYAKEFDSKIMSQSEVDGKYHVVLAETLFYPSGGGQPCDLGFINGIEVLDVHEHGDEIIHVLKEKIEGEEIAHGVIDWDRRFEFMQQHLGEHIFAGELYNLHNLHTLRMRIEGDNVSIDLGENVDEGIIFEAEALANEAVYQNLPVQIIYPDMEEVKAHARKLPPEKSTQPIRIVKIEGVDYVPCCGLHVSSTGQVGLIKITSFENHKGGKRIYLRSGRAAYRWLSSLHHEVRLAESELVCGYEGINEKIASLKSQIHDLKTHNESIIEHFLEPVACELVKNAQIFGNNKLVRHVMKDSSQDEIKHLFRLLTANNPEVVALLAGVSSQGAFIIFGCNRDNKSVDVRAAFKTAITLLEGKGGGSAFSAQGWGTKSELVESALDESAKIIVKGISQNE